MDGSSRRGAAIGRRAVVTGLAATALAGCASTPQEPAAPAAPATPPAPPAPKLAPTDGRFPLIADTANRLNAGHAAGLAALGVRTVFRYYSYVPSNILGKDLQPEEAQILMDAGLSIGAVWQHFNNCHLTFEKGWGKRDAEQALRLAEAVKQPAGSAVYFGVDGDWPYKTLLDPVLRYFEDVVETFQGSGLDLGAYGGGCILEQLRQRGMAKYFWLSGSTGFTGTQAFYNSGAWTLFQNALDVTPDQPRVGIDTNICNPIAGGYFGQFSAAGATPSAHDLAATQAVFESRRFLRQSASLLAKPEAGAATLTKLRIRSNVRVLAEGEGWAEVQTQEGGRSRAGAARTGYLPLETLAPLDKMPGGATSFGVCGVDQAAPASVRDANCPAAARAFRGG